MRSLSGHSIIPSIHNRHLFISKDGKVVFFFLLITLTLKVEISKAAAGS